MDEAFRARINEVGFAKAAAERGASVSGGPIRPFAGGWGCAPFLGRGRSVVHHWEVLPRRPQDDPGVTGVRSACGVLHIITERVPMLGPGNLAYCQRCDAKVLKQRMAR